MKIALQFYCLIATAHRHDIANKVNITSNVDDDGIYGLGSFNGLHFTHGNS